MATYKYKCNECRKKFEIVRSMKDNNLTDCPKCCAVDSLEQIIVPSGGFRIRGKGVHKQTSKFD